MMTTRFSDLPDSIEPSELATLFRGFLNQNKLSISGSAIYELAELADRQWHTYELLDESLRKKVDSFVSKILKNSDFDVVKKAIYVIGCLGLRKSFLLLPGCEKKIDRAEEKSYLQKAIEELGNSIEDPFSGMR